MGNTRPKDLLSGTLKIGMPANEDCFEQSNTFPYTDLFSDTKDLPLQEVVNQCDFENSAFGISFLSHFLTDDRELV
jgi:hypothetical protein